MFKTSVLIVFLFGSHVKTSSMNDDYIDESFDSPPPSLAHCAEEGFSVRAFEYCAAAAQCVYDIEKLTPAPNTTPTTTTHLPTTTTHLPTTTTPLPTTPVPTTPVPTTTTPAPTHKCSSGYEYSNRTQRCYKAHLEPKYWHGANDVCKEEGAALAVINSDEEIHVITEIKIQNITNTYIPIGVYLDSSNVWRTVDGETMEESGYNKRYQPQECKREEKLLGYLSSNGTIKIFCSSSYGQDSFICEKPTSA